MFLALLAIVGICTPCFTPDSVGFADYDAAGFVLDSLAADRDAEEPKGARCLKGPPEATGWRELPRGIPLPSPRTVSYPRRAGTLFGDSGFDARSYSGRIPSAPRQSRWCQMAGRPKTRLKRLTDAQQPLADLLRRLDEVAPPAAVRGDYLSAPFGETWRRLHRAIENVSVCLGALNGEIADRLKLDDPAEAEVSDPATCVWHVLWIRNQQSRRFDAGLPTVPDAELAADEGIAWPVVGVDPGA